MSPAATHYTQGLWPDPDGPFVVVILWGEFAGALEPCGLEIRSLPRPEDLGGEPLGSLLEASTKRDLAPARPLTATDLHRLPFRSIVEAASAGNAGLLKLRAQREPARKAELDAKVAAWEAGASRRIRLQSKGAAFYAEVAEVYLAAETNPTQAVARHFGGHPDPSVKGGFDNYAAAAVWVWRCRRDGYLPPVPARKAGTR